MSAFSASNRIQGRVVRFDRARGYGFVALSDGREIFLHRKALAGMRVEPGDLLEFALFEAGQGLAAEHIEIIVCQSTALATAL